MKLVPIQHVGGQIKAGAALPLGVRDADGKLLLAKEFGIYPPGALVKRASGDVAVAVRRGTSGNTPIVSAVMNRQGDALGSPIRRDTAIPEHAVTGLVPAQALRVKLNPHQLFDRRLEG